MKEISLTRGRVTLVDDEDYEWLMQYKWNVDGRGYVVTSIGIPGSYNKLTAPKGKHKVVKMHRLIMNTPKGMECDHRNTKDPNNKLNNQRSNLRNCTKSQNMRNVPKQSNRSSVYKGVSWSKSKSKWRAYISINGRYIHLGYFSEERWAAMAHDIWTKDIVPEFAVLNF